MIVDRVEVLADVDPLVVGEEHAGVALEGGRVALADVEVVVDGPVEPDQLLQLGQPVAQRRR